MLEFLVLGVIPGTDTQITLSTIAYTAAGFFGGLSLISFISHIRLRQSVSNIIANRHDSLAI